MTPSFKTLAALACSLCVGLAQAADADAGSGFLSDYASLAPTQDSAGQPVLRYINPSFQQGRFHAVLLEPVTFFPKPEPTERVTADTLAKISRYLHDGLQSRAATLVPSTTEPAPGVLRLRAAITAVTTQNSPLKAYQYVPIAFLISAAKGRSQEAVLQIELELVDSLSGERMAAVVRKGTGVALADKAALQLSDVQALLDQWVETGVATLTAALR